MGLVKNKVLNNGTEVNYWNIHNIKSVYKKDSLHVVVVGYANKDYNDGHNYVDVCNFNFNVSNFVDSEPIRSEIYAKIKESIIVEDLEYRQKNILIIDEETGKMIENPDFVPLMIESNFFVDAEDDM